MILRPLPAFALVAAIVLALPASAQTVRLEEGACKRVAAPGQNFPGPYYVLFDTGKSAVKPEFKPEMRKAARDAKNFHVTRICVIGTTDKVGNAAYNKKLSRDRAYAVARELMAEGVKAQHLLLDYTGEPYGQWSFGAREKQEQDRRVVVLLAK